MTPRGCAALTILLALLDAPSGFFVGVVDAFARASLRRATTLASAKGERQPRRRFASAATTERRRGPEFVGRKRDEVRVLRATDGPCYETTEPNVPRAPAPERIDDGSDDEEKGTAAAAGGGTAEEGFDLSRIADLEPNLSPPEISKLSRRGRYEHRLKQLLDYKAEHGDTDVPRNYEADPRLGRWVRTQRYEYRLRRSGKKSYLTNERIRALNEMGFDWRCRRRRSARTTRGADDDIGDGATGDDGDDDDDDDVRIDADDGLDRAFLDQWEALRQYKRKHGHLLIPQSHGREGQFVKNQRRQHKTRSLGLKSTLTDKRIAKLNELGFVWDARGTGRTSYDAAWIDRLGELKTFKDAHGHCDVPKSSGELGRWVSLQRSAYKHRLAYGVSSLTEERERLLREVGLEFDGMRSWASARDATWHDRCEELRAYREKHDHADVPVSEGALGVWVQTQRAQYRRFNDDKSSPSSFSRNDKSKGKRRKKAASSMTEERIEKLNSLGFTWDVNEAKWMEQCRRLAKFRDDFGHVDVPSVYPPDPALARWVTNQRRYYRLHRKGVDFPLTEARKGALDALGFGNPPSSSSRRPSTELPAATATAELLELRWETKFEVLAKFKDERGHCLVPRNYETDDGSKLGNWVSDQRKQYRLSKEGKTSPLNDDRIRKLEGIGFVWSVKRGRKKTRAEEQ